MTVRTDGILKTCIVSVILCVIMCSCGLSENEKFEMQKETAHFEFYCEEKNSSDIEELAEILENSYKSFSRHLKTELSEKVRVKIYPDIASFRRVAAKQNNISEGEIPDWVCTSTDNKGIYMISPKNAEYKLSPKNITINAAIQLNNIMIYNICKDAPYYLTEFMPRYETELYYGVSADVAECMQNGTFPSIDDVTGLKETDEYSLSYFTLVEYIIDNYGYNKIIELINRADIEKCLGKNKAEIEKEWLDWVRLTYMEKLDFSRETEHFIIEYNEQDAESAEKAEQILENNYTGITSKLGVDSDKKYNIKIYPTNNVFRKVRQHEIAVVDTNAITGYYNAKSGVLNILSYNDPESWSMKSNFEELLVHEFIHAAIDRLNKQVYIFLNEGTATYMSEEIGAAFLLTVNPSLYNDTFPSVAQLKSMTAKDYDKGIYEFGCAFVQYIVEEYGYPYLTEFIKKQDIQAVFGITEEEFDKACVEFLKEKYIR